MVLWLAGLITCDVDLCSHLHDPCIVVDMCDKVLLVLLM